MRRNISKHINACFLKRRIPNMMFQLSAEPKDNIRFSSGVVMGKNDTPRQTAATVRKSVKTVIPTVIFDPFYHDLCSCIGCNACELNVHTCWYAPKLYSSEKFYFQLIHIPTNTQQLFIPQWSPLMNVGDTGSITRFKMRRSYFPLTTVCLTTWCGVPKNAHGSFGNSGWTYHNTCSNILPSPNCSCVWTAESSGTKSYVAEIENWILPQTTRTQRNLTEQLFFVAMLLMGAIWNLFSRHTVKSLRRGQLEDDVLFSWTLLGMILSCKTYLPFPGGGLHNQDLSTHWPKTNLKSSFSATNNILIALNKAKQFENRMLLWPLSLFKIVLSQCKSFNKRGGSGHDFGGLLAGVTTAMDALYSLREYLQQSQGLPLVFDGLSRVKIIHMNVIWVSEIRKHTVVAKRAMRVVKPTVVKWAGPPGGSGMAKAMNC